MIFVENTLGLLPLVSFVQSCLINGFFWHLLIFVTLYGKNESYSVLFLSTLCNVIIHFITVFELRNEVLELKCDSRVKLLYWVRVSSP